MGRRFVCDTETDGFLDELTKVHCIGLYDLDRGKYKRFVGEEECRAAVLLLEDADLIVGHNWIKFDGPALAKVFGFKPRGLVRDTLVLTSVLWPHVGELDHPRVKAKRMPGNLLGAQTLEAWGYRLGNYKGDFKGPWDTYTEEMGAYMDQDVFVTRGLWERILRELHEWGINPYDRQPAPGKDCVELEHRVAEIAFLIERHGWRVNRDKIVALTAKLTARKAQLEAELVKVFPPKEVATTFIPQVNNKRYGYVKGEPFVKRRSIAFNPASRQMVAERLVGLGWVPSAFTKDGTPQVDDEILTALPYPEAKVLAEFFVVDKRLGQIANGKQAWLKHLKNGRIHHRIKTNGAHTGRMTHSSPNVGQVPGNSAPYGEECRDVWEADEGYVLVGVDADALEDRCLAHFLAKHDEGAYTKSLLQGTKAEGTDPHSRRAALLAPLARTADWGREPAKTFHYALIYGAADASLGGQLGGGAELGQYGRLAIINGIDGFAVLVRSLHAAVDTRKWFRGLDGRRLSARAKNAALNTLLQSAGAVLMKRGLVILYDTLRSAGHEFGSVYALHGLIHDEWQASVHPDYADTYGAHAVRAIRWAGDFYSFRCPLDGQSSHVNHPEARSWKDTH